MVVMPSAIKSAQTACHEALNTRDRFVSVDIKFLEENSHLYLTVFFDNK